jgi:hypothetical protein
MLQVRLQQRCQPMIVDTISPRMNSIESMHQIDTVLREADIVLSLFATTVIIFASPTRKETSDGSF